MAIEVSIDKKYFVAFGEVDNIADLHESPRYDMSAMAPVFSPDGRYIFYILSDYGVRKSRVFVSDTKTGKVKKWAEHDHISNAVLAPDGRSVLYTVISEGKEVRKELKFE